MGNFIKIVSEYVEQHFELRPGEGFVCVGQEFIASDGIAEYTDEYWDKPVDPPDSVL